MTGICESLPAQIKISLRINLEEIIIHQIIDEVDGFSGTFHFRAKLFVYFRKFAV
jgi:hypothetical protein